MTSALDHFKGKHVLVVEDEFLIAETTCMDLEECGAIVVGPVPTVARAQSLLQTRQVDAALLDIKLNEETSISMVNELQRRAIPFVFVSNINASELPPRFRDFLVGKPADMTTIARGLFESQNPG
jgi:CheY-like chemotaxis protein